MVFVADDRYGSRNIYYNNTYVIVGKRKERTETVTFECHALCGLCVFVRLLNLPAEGGIIVYFSPHKVG